MKRKLAGCLESSKALYSRSAIAPAHWSAIRAFSAALPPNSNVAHDRSLQRKSSNFRPVLIQLLFQSSGVCTAAMDLDISLPHLQQLLAQSGVPPTAQPQRALHHLHKVVHPLLSNLIELCIAGTNPMLANVLKLKHIYHAKNKAFAAKILEAKHPSKPRAKKKNSEFVLPALC